MRISARRLAATTALALVAATVTVVAVRAGGQAPPGDRTGPEVVTAQPPRPGSSVAGRGDTARPDRPTGDRAGGRRPGRATAASVLAPVLAGGVPQTPLNPTDLAAHITVSEDVVRDPRSSPAQVRAAGWVGQMAYRTLGYRPAWDQTVRSAVPARYRAVVGHQVAARREFQALQGRDLPGKLPAWRIVAPLPAQELKAIYLDAQARFAVPWEVLAAINLVETGMGRIVGLSSAGADGPMQFIPETWAAYGMGGDVRDPHDAIMGAANYLRARGGAAGTEQGLREALYSYNNSGHYVRAVRHYAAIIAGDPAAYLGMHAWQIYYRTPRGDFLLPVGYETERSIPVGRYLSGARATAS